MHQGTPRGGSFEPWDRRAGKLRNSTVREHRQGARYNYICQLHLARQRLSSSQYHFLLFISDRSITRGEGNTCIVAVARQRIASQLEGRGRLSLRRRHRSFVRSFSKVDRVVFVQQGGGSFHSIQFHRHNSKGTRRKVRHLVVTVTYNHSAL